MTVPPRLRQALAGAGARRDVLAGITVTAYLVPQVMAYAELAGLPGRRRAVGVGRRPGGVRRARQLAAAVRRPGVDHCTDDGGGSGRDRRRPVGPGGGAGDSWSRGLPAGVGGRALAAGRSALPTGAGRLHGRHRGGAWSSRSWASWPAPTRPATSPGRAGCCSTSTRCTCPRWSSGLVTLAVMLTGSALWPRAPMALVGMVGATIAVGRARPAGPRSGGDRARPVRAAHPLDPRHQRRRAGRARAGRAGGGVRRLLRQHPRRPRVRDPAGREDRRPSRAAGPGRLQPRCGGPARHAGEQLGQPHRDLRRDGRPDPAGRAGHRPRHHPRDPPPGTGAGPLPPSRTRRGRGLRRDPARRRPRVPPDRALPPQRAADRGRDHDGRGGGRGAAGRADRDRPVAARPAPSGGPAPRRGRGLRPRPGRHARRRRLPRARRSFPGWSSTATTPRCSSRTPTTSSPGPWPRSTPRGCRCGGSC